MGSLLVVQRRRRGNGKLVSCAKKEKGKWEACYLCKEGEGGMGSLLAVQRRRRGNGKLISCAKKEKRKWETC